MVLELHQNAGFQTKKQTANEYCSPCPGCGGTDRFIIFTDKETYWCRQCNKKGDAIQYLIEFRGMSFPDAARVVGKNFYSEGRKHSKPATTSEKNSLEMAQPEKWLSIAGRFIEWANKKLMDNSCALTCLRQERGITKETAASFQLGWSDHNVYRKKDEWGLESNGKKLFIPSGLVIPWQGKRIRVRRDDPGDYPRYHIVSGSNMESMTIGTPNERTAIIVESELDAILLSQEIKREVFIVALGSCAIKPDQALQNDLSSCPVVLVVLDTDEAGAKASRWWLENVPSTFRTLTPRQYGKDITEGFLSGLDLNEWLSVSIEICSESAGDFSGSSPF